MPPVLRLGVQRLCALAVAMPVPASRAVPAVPFAYLRSLHSSPLVRAARGDPQETTSEMLDRMAREAKERRAADPGRDYVGPLPLGVGAEARRKTWKPWKDLNAGGKSEGARSGNLIIVLVGGSLAVILAIALSTELFAKNSPSVLYSECIDMIRDTNALDQFLLPPVSFTHSQHATAPTRGSAPVVHRMLVNPTSGREHLLLTFWAHGRGKDEPEPLSWAKSWVQKGEEALRSVGGWVGLAADPDGPVENPLPSKPVVEEVVVVEEPQGPGFFGRLARSLSLTSGSSVTTATAKPSPPGTYKMGEVRADYVKNAQGIFTLLALVVDVPSAKAAYPGRATVFWSPEANQESLINRR